MEAISANHTKEPAMLKKLMLATAALGSFALAAPAFADGGHRGHGHGHFKHHHGHRHHFHHYQPRRPVVVMPPPRVYYAPPAPVYYAPPPVAYRPAPVYAAPVYAAPVPQSSVSVRLHFPL
jgi:hypothetical protein